MHTPIVLTGSYSEQMDTVFAAASDILYQRRGTIVRVRDNAIDEVTATSLQSHLIDHLTPITVKVTKDGDEQQVPQKKFDRELCQHMLDRTEISLRSLKYVYRCPVFAGDWQPIGEHGYHESAEAWLDTQAIEGADLMPISRATSMIDELLCDFPFADTASKTHAIMAMITPFIRPMVGLMPLFLVTAPTEGSGKSLLAQLCGLIAEGYHITSITAPSDDDEWRKRITSTLMESPSVILLDNVNDLDSPSLASALTSNVWTDRHLGLSKNISVPNNAVWFASGNNPTISAEMARRCVPIRLVPDTERPGERKFRHPDIERHVIEHRDELIGALMSIVYHWTQERTMVDVSMGSYQRWASAAASIAASAGYHEALTNREVMRTEESDELASLVDVWASHPNYRKQATAGDLETLCSDDEILAHIRGGSPHKSARAKRLSKYIATHTDRVVGQWRICVGVDSHSKQRTYSLEAVM